MTDQTPPSTSDGRFDVGRWTELLRRAASSAGAEALLEGTEAGALIASFSDEQGDRRRIDPVFLSAVLGVEPDASALGSGLDDAMWRCAADAGAPVPELAPAGALSAWPSTEAIELWTETELSSLHALWRVARVRAPSLRARCMEAARWHVANTQPDHATGQAWAIHVFVVLGVSERDLGAILYAEGLLHACQVLHGRADRRSALILLDASRELAMLDQTR